jgi:vancomycin permeability regulator SanA
VRWIKSHGWKVAAILAGLWVFAAVGIAGRGLATPAPRTPGDLAVVFGNALNEDGQPKPVLTARLQAALACYQAGMCRNLLVSGGIDGPGLNEATAMRDWLVGHGVPASRTFVDEQGDNTLLTVRHTVDSMRLHQWTSVVVVTQFYHQPRVMLTFGQSGVDQVTGLYPHTFLFRDIYSSWREVPAFAFYATRLGSDPDAQAISIRPMLYLQSLWHKLVTR